jgi:hypothetical protein
MHIKYLKKHILEVCLSILDTLCIWTVFVGNTEGEVSRETWVSLENNIQVGFKQK